MSLSNVCNKFRGLILFLLISSYKLTCQYVKAIKPTLVILVLFLTSSIK